MLKVKSNAWIRGKGILCHFCTRYGQIGPSTGDTTVNALRPRQNGHHFADDTFKRIFFNENVRISMKISLKFVPKGPINNIPTLVQIMAWRRSGDKPLSEPMMVSLLTHICITLPQWVKIIALWPGDAICFIVELVNIGSDNGLLPDGTKPLPEPIMTNHQWGLVAFTWGQFHRECSRSILDMIKLLS